MKKEKISKFNIPSGGNKRLEKLMANIRKDEVLNLLLRMSNITAIDRMGINDHGPVHVRIVANAALKILRIFRQNGIKPSLVKNYGDYGFKDEDGEVVVVLASVLHDIGHVIHRTGHEEMSTVISFAIIDDLLKGIYEEIEKRTILKYEVAHAIYCHEPPIVPLTIEGGVVKVADALDMEMGRARIPYRIGTVSIHSVSAMAIKKVSILKGEEKPVKIKILMSNPAGIFQVDELLREKIRTSGIKEMFEVEARITKGRGEEVLKKY